MNTVRNMNMCEITYQSIRNAMKGEPYTMQLIGTDYELFAEAVNQGIDCQLEACFSKDRGDKITYKRKADITISEESLPVLIRRLLESENEKANDLGESILYSLGFQDNGTYKDPDQ